MRLKDDNRFNGVLKYLKIDKRTEKCKKNVFLSSLFVQVIMKQIEMIC